MKRANFLRACDEWQFPIFLTLILTDLRPGDRILPDASSMASFYGISRSEQVSIWEIRVQLSYT